MTTWQELDDLEKEWLVREEQNHDSKQRIAQIRNAYDEHCSQSLRFVQGLQERFHGYENSHAYGYAMDDILRISRLVQDDLEEIEDDLKRKDYVISRHLDEIGIEKRIANSVEEGSH